MGKRVTAKILVLALVLAAGCLGTPGGDGKVLAKKHSPVKKVKVGKRISLGNSKTGAKYKSSNSQIASVDSKGMVTGKRTGTVKITKEIQKKKKTYTIRVTKNPRKPASLPVTLDEVKLLDGQIQMQSQGKAVYSARIRNTASKGTIRKIVYHFEIQVKVSVSETTTGNTADTGDGTATEGEVATGSAVSTGSAAATGSSVSTGDAAGQSLSAGETKTELQKKTVTITAKNIAPGKTSGKVQCEGDYAGLVSNMKLKEIDLYTGSARYRYTTADGKYLFSWATKDKKAPKIKGLVKGSSCTGHDDPYQTVYTDKKNDWHPTKFVSATDDRDGKVKVNADTSKINWKKSGIYKVYFTAEDKAGNVARSWAKVRVIVPGTAESIADQALRSITKSSWSDEKKARAIYRYVRGRISYVHNAPHKDWRVTAVQGLRYQSGDCYTYYSVSRLLLTRAGIPNVMINRDPAPRGIRHFWNLAYVKGGWYHFDTTPRIRGAASRNRENSFCLWTDAQMFGYSSGYTFQFRRSSYVKRAEKRI